MNNETKAQLQEIYSKSDKLAYDEILYRTQTIDNVLELYTCVDFSEVIDLHDYMNSLLAMLKDFSLRLNLLTEQNAKNCMALHSAIAKILDEKS